MSHDHRSSKPPSRKPGLLAPIYRPAFTRIDAAQAASGCKAASASSVVLSPERLEAAKALLDQFSEAKRRPGWLGAERARFVDVAARHLVADKTSRDGSPGPHRRWRRSARSLTSI